jgi:hypothetical protein
MKTQRSSCYQGPCRERLTVLLLLIVLAAAGFTASCGGGSSTPKFSGNTNVTVVMSSTANDELYSFGMHIEGLTLTTQSGKVVALLSSQPAEFIHVNGEIEPLATVTIPQGVYTSATATLGNSLFACVTITNAGSIETSNFGVVPTPPAGVTVKLPAPITITGDSMALDLDLQVQTSFTLTSCDATDNDATFSITPTFNLTAASFSAQPTNAGNGKAIGIDGQVSSVNTAGNSFVMAYPSDEAPRTVTVSTGAGTVFQGVNSFAGLAVGTFVNMDGVVQGDGSLAATRIAVEDPTATSAEIGPLLFVSEAAPALNIVEQESQGILLVGGATAFSFGNATFQISGQLSNLNSLPFTPMFNAGNMVAGQNVYLSTTATTFGPEPIYAPAQTITLIPQTVDGTVSSTSTSGNFTIYTVNLASYELFPTLAVQGGQTTLLNNPSEVEVYVDNSTQIVSSQQPTPGVTFRFYGLVFNDHGTLRMDCAQVEDGVPVTPPMNAAATTHSFKGVVHVVGGNASGPARVINVQVTPAK